MIQPLHLTDETYDLLHAGSYRTLLSVTPDGITCITADCTRKKFVYLRHQPSDARLSVTDSLKKFVVEEPVLKARQRSILAMAWSKKTLLVPSPLYDEDKSNVLISFGFEQDSSGKAISVKVPKTDALLVSVIDAEVYNMFMEMPDVKVLPHLLPLIIKTQSATQTIAMHCNISGNQAAFFASNAETPLYCNTFEYKSPEDLAYFALAIAKLHTNETENLSFTLSGIFAKNDARVNELKGFFKELKLAKAGSNYIYSYRFNEIPQHYFAPLFELTHENY